MPNYEVTIPKLGESVIEATLTKWLKNDGDTVQVDEPLVEIATDKVDSEIVSPVAGTLKKKVFGEGSVVAVGAVFAILDTLAAPENESQAPAPELPAELPAPEPIETPEVPSIFQQSGPQATEKARFYSPLVRSIAHQEGISFKELDAIPGTGKDDRVTKQDILNYLQGRKPGSKPPERETAFTHETIEAPALPVLPGENQIIEMDRIRQIIANHMVKSVQTSPHVTSFMEVDMTRIVQWREKNKDDFFKREHEKLTFTPIVIEAIAKSVRDYPMVNVSVEGTKILLHKRVNIGMAVALPNFNLIVPVIHNAHEKSLLGIIKAVNNLAERARISKLLPDEISGGTISLTNLGSFGTIMGTPIINQPQAAIVAMGTIRKMPVVIEGPEGDSIAIRSMMVLSVTYDHRVVDGALGGQFLSRIVHYLNTFNINQPI